MNERVSDLPDYKNPPVTEVALSVQFEPLSSLRLARLGMLWNLFREQFPKLEEHPPLSPAVEDFERQGPRKIKLRVQEGPPTVRCWFLNEKGSELIQVQEDRFVHNWRKIKGDEEYPRYDFIRATFEKELMTFQDFVAAEGIGEILPTQCEVTYVNQIVQGEGWGDHGEIEKIFSVWKSEYSDAFLSHAEDIRFAIRFQIPGSEGKPLGRLHVTVQPAFRVNDNKPIITMTLTARGKPLDKSPEGIRSFLDLGREWVVRGFTSITTRQMHQIWERVV